MVVKNQGDINKVCSFYAGNGHFLAMVLPFLIDKIRKGSKVLLFVDESLREKIPEFIPNIDNSFRRTDWQENVVLYPLETTQKVKGRKFFTQHIKSIVELLSCSCSSEGIIICVQREKRAEEDFLNQIEDMTADVLVPIFLINCHEFDEDRDIALRLMSEHAYILNSMGISRIEKVYPDIQIKVMA